MTEPHHEPYTESGGLAPHPLSRAIRLAIAARDSPGSLSKSAAEGGIELHPKFDVIAPGTASRRRPAPRRFINCRNFMERTRVELVKPILQGSVAPRCPPRKLPTQPLVFLRRLPQLDQVRQPLPVPADLYVLALDRDDRPEPRAVSSSPVIEAVVPGDQFPDQLPRLGRLRHQSLHHDNFVTLPAFSNDSQSSSSIQPA